MVEVSEDKKTIDSDSQQNSTSESESEEEFSKGMASNTLPFSRLKGRENYSEWKVGAKAHMIIKGHWQCCTVQIDLETANEKARGADLKALGELTLLLEPCNYSHIESANTCKQAWDGIAAAFDDTGTGRKVALLQQLVSLKMKECSSMEDYVNKMTALWSKVKAAGFSIDDKTAGSLMLVGLPSEYKPMILAIENSVSEITVDYVKNLLLQGLVFDSDTNEMSETALAAGNKWKKKFVRHCFGCGSKEHFVKNCPNKVKNSSRNNNQSKGKSETMLFTSLLVQSNDLPSDWYMDSGATAHMSKHE